MLSCPLHVPYHSRAEIPEKGQTPLWPRLRSVSCISSAAFGVLCVHEDHLWNCRLLQISVVRTKSKTGAGNAIFA